MNAKRSTLSGCSVRGSALIVVLWVLGLMSMFVMSFVFDAHVEARITSYYRKRTKATYLAYSGVDIAQMLLARRGQIRDDQEKPEDENDRWFENARRLKQGAAMGVVETLGEGTVTVDIIPEPARRNINNLDLNNNKNVLDVERNLERILEVGGIREEMNLWPSLIESFQDWIDADQNARPDGAETDDYYALLTPPYKAKDGPLDTVGELLLVKGFTRPILYGGVLQPAAGRDDEVVSASGIGDLLTVYGSGLVDINAASMRVLMTLPDMDEVAAGALIEEREGLLDVEGKPRVDHFNDVNDLFGRLPDLPPTIRKYLTVSSGVYRITSVGEVGGVRRRIWCIAEFSQGQGLSILEWREEN